jgi:hypothetical protein
MKKTRSKEELINSMYKNMKARAKKKNLSILSKEDFLEFCKDNQQLNQLYDR